MAKTKIVIFLKNHYPIMFLLCLSIAIHWQWLKIDSIITHGDWMYFNDTILSSIRLFQFNTWLEDLNMGRGVFDLVQGPFWAIFGAAYKYLGFNFNITNHILVLYPIILVAPVGIYLLLGAIFQNKNAVFLGSLVYTFNSYFLMIQTGHMTLALAYSFVPIALLLAYGFLKSNGMKYFIGAILMTFIICILEFRFGFILMGLISLLFLIKLRVFSAIGFISILLLLNSYWIVPSFLSSFLFGNGVISRDIFGTHFFMQIQALFLYHPFWSYGKIEPFIVNVPNILYAILPISFFIILLNYKKLSKIPLVHFFLIIGILGLFLSKQNNPPFPMIYEWLYEYIPGFNMYREATKFYLLIALAFSFSISCIYSMIHKKILKILFIVIFTAYQISTVYSIISNNAGATFLPRTIPDSYTELNTIIEEGDGFSRTLWLPKYSRWASFSPVHQYISVSDLTNSNWSRLYAMGEPTHTNLSRFLDEMSDEYLTFYAIKYIVVPHTDIENDDNFYKDYGNQKELYIQKLKDRFGEPKELDGMYLFATKYNLPKIVNSSAISTIFQRNFSTNYTFVLSLKENITFKFLESFHPEWKLYLEPYTPLDCGSGATVYSGTVSGESRTDVNPPTPLVMGDTEQSVSTNTGIYLSQRGDTLASIARSQTDMTLTGIITLNPGVTREVLRRGTEITIETTDTGLLRDSRVARTTEQTGTGGSYHVTECPAQNTFYAGGELAKLWQEPIFDDTHQMVYDYANQWTIDPEYIRANYPKNYYKENPDGTIDVRMTMHFRPQSYFYLGLIISGLTLFGCLGYLVISSVRDRRKAGKQKVDTTEEAI